jgi:hypothetical protein
VTQTSIPVKTPEGLAELRQRTQRLSQRHRTVLLLVDGKRALIEVQTLALQAGAPQSCMDDLLDLGLVVITQPTVPVTRYSAAPLEDSQQPDIWLDSESPPADALAPHAVNGAVIDDVASALELPQPTAPASPLQHFADGAPDEALEEARDILLRAVRQEAPLAGSLTLLRLRRVRTRDELQALMEEVELRICRPQRVLAAAQTLRRVRQLLSGQPESQPPTL